MNKLQLAAALTLSAFMPPGLDAQDNKIGYSWNIAADNEGLWNMTTGHGAWNGLVTVEGGISPWHGGSIEAAALASYGTGAVADDIQGLTNIDAGENRAFRLSKLGIGQQFGRWTLFAGLRNVDYDYFTTPYTSLFTGSSYGNFPILSMNHPLATFPLSAMGIHAEYSPTGNIVVKESLYNGVASDRLNRQFRVRPGDDGFFNIGSVTYTASQGDDGFSPASYMFIYSIASLPEEGDTQQMHYTLLANVEQPLATIGGGRARLGLLLQGGWNPTPGEEACRGYAAMGIISEFSNGMTAGIAANRAFTLDGNESDIEFTFNYPLLRYFTVTPSLHCIFTQGHSCNVVGMLRLSFAIGN